MAAERGRLLCCWHAGLGWPKLSASMPIEGDGRALRFADGDFDVVVCHTVLCHVPEPERVLAEAFRVLRPGGTLAICDGDYATTTVALGEADPFRTASRP